MIAPHASLRLGIIGLRGRMGREVVAAADGDPEVWVAGGTVRPGSDAAGDVMGIPVAPSLAELLPGVDVVIDFSTPESSVATARLAAEAGTPAVIGTTGLAEDQMAELRAASARIPLHYARNTSTGVAALLEILPALARLLDSYDVELVEMHHRHKADAPSGTALALAGAIAAGSPLVHGRQGHASRRPGEIGVHAVRGGGNRGEHEVIFAGDWDEVRITHRAYDRRAFAAGALRAAKRLATLPPGWHGPP